jgi:hypothetical protein
LGLGKSGWTYHGTDPSVLDKDISEFLNRKATPRKANQQPKIQENKQTKKEENNNIIITENNPSSKKESKEIIKEERQPIIKKVTYEIEERLHDELKIKSVRDKRKVSEIVNELLKKGLGLE